MRRRDFETEVRFRCSCEANWYNFSGMCSVLGSWDRPGEEFREVLRRERKRKRIGKYLLIRSGGYWDTVSWRYSGIDRALNFSEGGVVWHVLRPRFLELVQLSRYNGERMEATYAPDIRAWRVDLSMSADSDFTPHSIGTLDALQRKFGW